MQYGETLHFAFRESALADTSFISKHLFLNTDFYSFSFFC